MQHTAKRVYPVLWSHPPEPPLPRGAIDTFHLYHTLTTLGSSFRRQSPSDWTLFPAPRRRADSKLKTFSIPII